ncbi:MAG: peptidoglycan-binding protein [Alphaproteobacteria bacterium]
MVEEGRIIDPESPREEIVELQTRLMSLGYDLPVYGADGDYGAETIAAIEKFQQDHGLEITGIATADTFSQIIDLQTERFGVLDQSLRDHILEVARAHIGIAEKNADNSGPEIAEFLGRDDPAAWCAGFASHIGNLEANVFDYSVVAKEILGQFRNNDAYYPADSDYSPQAGDLIFFERGLDGDWRGHVGFVEAVLDNGTIITIEGNKSPNDIDNEESAQWDPENPDSVRRVVYDPEEFAESRVLGYGNLSEMYIARNGYEDNFTPQEVQQLPQFDMNNFALPEI